MIPQRNISLLSNRLAKAGGRRIPEVVLERDYCLAWFLVGLSHSTLRDILAFKGGTALKRCYFGDYRFSEDLDFTLAKEASLDTILAGLEEIFTDIQQESGILISYSHAARKSHQNSHTFYLAYEGPLPSMSTKEAKGFCLDCRASLAMTNYAPTSVTARSAATRQSRSVDGADTTGLPRCARNDDSAFVWIVSLCSQ